MNSQLCVNGYGPACKDNKVLVGWAHKWGGEMCTNSHVCRQVLCAIKFSMRKCERDMLRILAQYTCNTQIYMTTWQHKMPRDTHASLIYVCVGIIEVALSYVN